CSGARSNSANGAIAARAAPDCSWSTSSSTVLSDCTIRGPSVIPSIIPTRRTPDDSVCRGLQGSARRPLAGAAGQRDLGDAGCADLVCQPGQRRGEHVGGQRPVMAARLRDDSTRDAGGAAELAQRVGGIGLIVGHPRASCPPSPVPLGFPKPPLRCCGASEEIANQPETPW